MDRRIFITGTAGFIGFHLARLLLSKGWNVHGFDALTDYYDVSLKKERHRILSGSKSFSKTIARLEDSETLSKAVQAHQPEIIVHLAAQAGVRYSIESPKSYIDSNLVGTFNVLEQAKSLDVSHLLMASTSSVYGTNRAMPFVEDAVTDTPMSLYAATKKANEAMAHSYAHLFNTPTTMFRFFTVYGPWGRPDLALYKFVKAAIEGHSIDVFNYGEMARDFTYVSDLVRAIERLLSVPPVTSGANLNNDGGDTPSAPYRVVNIGNGEKVPLMRFINATETALGREIPKNFLPMQMGDVPETWANTDLLFDLTGYRPNTSVEQGIKSFVDWYLEYYQTSVSLSETTRVA